MHNIFKIHVGNAFTSSKYDTLGNPAGFHISKIFPAVKNMSAIAVATNLPMTAFVCPRGDDKKSFDIRYYDQGGRECHICGHGTLIATACLRALGYGLETSSLTFYLNPVYFESAENVLHTDWDGEEISLDLMASDLSFCGDDRILKTSLAKIFDINIADILNVAFSNNIRDYVVEVASTDILQSLTPNFADLKDMAEKGRYQHEGMMVTAYCDNKESEFDIYSRAFLPITGVNEDIVCGSANCSIVPYWCAKGLSPRLNGVFKGLFPYPPAGKGKLGGVQTIRYVDGDKVIRLTSEAQLISPMEVSIELTASKAASA